MGLGGTEKSASPNYEMPWRLLAPWRMAGAGAERALFSKIQANVAKVPHFVVNSGVLEFEALIRAVVLLLFAPDCAF